MITGPSAASRNLRPRRPLCNFVSVMMIGNDIIAGNVLQFGMKTCIVSDKSLNLLAENKHNNPPMI
jgi:hypothetical protein